MKVKSPLLKTVLTVIYEVRHPEIFSLSRPLCLFWSACEKANPFRPVWRLAHVDPCIVHETELVHCCPKCDHELKWKPLALIHIASLRYYLAGYRVDKAGAEPTTGGGNPKANHEFSLSSSFIPRRCMVMRFFDMQLAESQTFPIDIARLTMLFSFSYPFFGWFWISQAAVR